MVCCLPIAGFRTLGALPAQHGRHMTPPAGARSPGAVVALPEVSAVREVSAGRRRAAGVAVRLVGAPRAYPVTALLMTALLTARILRHVTPELVHRWWWATSTSLDQLAHHPLGVLFGSIPWVTGGPVIPWLALAALAVGGLEATLGSVAAFAVVFGGHTGATLISEGILGLRVATGNLPSSALHILDVGPSYVVATALAAVAVLPTSRRLRLTCAVALGAIAPAMMFDLVYGDVDGIGHTAAFALGALAAALPALRRRAARSAAGRCGPADGSAGGVGVEETVAGPVRVADAHGAGGGEETSRRRVLDVHQPALGRPAGMP